MMRQGHPLLGSTIKALAFDTFPIFDPRPIFGLAETLFPGKGTLYADLHLEYAVARARVRVPPHRRWCRRRHDRDPGDHLGLVLRFLLERLEQRELPGRQA